ncbi:MAG: glycoside hydrolase family 5 protein [Deltaproteobacteria bacterium]|nr:glycoside hydrolase family 5 protein [Deltaproteobacteria bacterium]
MLKKTNALLFAVACIGGCAGDLPSSGVPDGGTDTGADARRTSDSGLPLPDAGTRADSGHHDHDARPDSGPPARGYLVVVDGALRDSEGRAARLTGVNWFGFETSNKAPHGLWSRDYKSMLAQVRAVGFNSLRLPWSNAILEPGAMPQSISFAGTDAYNQTTPINKDLEGKTAIQVLDAIIEEAGKLGLRVILDNHSRKPDGYMNEALWYTQDFSEEKWIQDWLVVAERYRGNPVVVAFDLDNEPHDEATWAEGEPTRDWRAAAERCGNAILKVNPDALIVVEGVEEYKGKSTWWGGNLAGARSQPIRLTDPKKLVYSPHEYGPEVFAQSWFSSPDYPSNMKAIWDEHFGFIADSKLGHVLVGEFGIRDRDAHGGKAYTWFTEFMKYGGSRFSWTYWCWNPNSGDTGGILKDDWVSVNDWKVDVLKPHLAPLIPAN